VFVKDILLSLQLEFICIAGCKTRYISPLGEMPAHQTQRLFIYERNTVK